MDGVESEKANALDHKLKNNLGDTLLQKMQGNLSNIGVDKITKYPWKNRLISKHLVEKNALLGTVKMEVINIQYGSLLFDLFISAADHVLPKVFDYGLDIFLGLVEESFPSAFYAAIGENENNDHQLTFDLIPSNGLIEEFNQIPEASHSIQNSEAKEPKSIESAGGSRLSSGGASLSSAAGAMQIINDFSNTTTPVRQVTNPISKEISQTEFKSANSHDQHKSTGNVWNRIGQFVSANILLFLILVAILFMIGYQFNTEKNRYVDKQDKLFSKYDTLLSKYDGLVNRLESQMRSAVAAPPPSTPSKRK